MGGSAQTRVQGQEVRGRYAPDPNRLAYPRLGLRKNFRLRAQAGGAAADMGSWRGARRDQRGERGVRHLYRAELFDGQTSGSQGPRGGPRLEGLGADSHALEQE